MNWIKTQLLSIYKQSQGLRNVSQEKIVPNNFVQKFTISNPTVQPRMNSLRQTFEIGIGLGISAITCYVQGAMTDKTSNLTNCNRMSGASTSHDQLS